MEKVTYRIVKILPDKPGERPPVLIEECLDGHPVNLYTGYDHGDDKWMLFPKHRIIPSVVDIKKKSIGYTDARRAY